MVVSPCNPSDGEAEMGDSMGSLDSWPSLLRKSHPSEKIPSQQKKKTNKNDGGETRDLDL